MCTGARAKNSHHGSCENNKFCTLWANWYCVNICGFVAKYKCVCTCAKGKKYTIVCRKNDLCLVLCMRVLESRGKWQEERDRGEERKEGGGRGREEGMHRVEKGKSMESHGEEDMRVWGGSGQMGIQLPLDPHTSLILSPPLFSLSSPLCYLSPYFSAWFWIFILPSLFPSLLISWSLPHPSRLLILPTQSSFSYSWSRAE